MGGSDEACFGQTVRKYKAAFGVGVVYHDCLTVLGGKDIAGEHRLVADGVFGQAADGADLHGQFQGGDGLDGCQSGGGTAHVADHFGHGFGRFEAEAAGIEGETLANDDQVVGGAAGSALACCSLGAVVGHGNHVGFVGATLANGNVAHEAFLFQLLHVADLDGKARSILGDGLGAFDELGGVKVAGASVDQVLGQGDGLLFDGNFFGDGLEFGNVFAGDDFEGDLEVFFLLALVGVKLVIGVVEAVGDGLELFGGGIGKHDAHYGNLAGHGLLGQAIGGHAQVVQIRDATLLGGVDENGGGAIDFQKFQVFEGAFLHAGQNGFYLLFGGFGKDVGELDGLLDKKKGGHIGLARRSFNNIQFHMSLM